MKAKINMQFKIDYPVFVEVPDGTDLEQITAEEWEILAYKNRNEEIQKLYDCTFEAVCTEVICNDEDFIKRFNEEA